MSTEQKEIDWDAIKLELVANHDGHNQRQRWRHMWCTDCMRPLYRVDTPPPPRRRSEVVLADGFVCYRGPRTDALAVAKRHPGAKVRRSTE